MSKNIAKIDPIKKNIYKDEYILKQIAYIPKSAKSPLISLVKLLIKSKVPSEITNSKIFDTVTINPHSGQWVYRNNNMLINSNEPKYIFLKAYHYFTIDMIKCLRVENKGLSAKKDFLYVKSFLSH